ncbi:OLC1v1014045C1 [Oldenlandia corymbosa var. corymbosa]|uniref:OLC1v1014045C1 n=1 Tax=Oldenlandia corymbosa var. corymbosa TaxID=529605 RepID=A0AAV1E336_OLDCO|nr:OLC1v1014045C1 [Oldenlandia corymbosa var. corymbosa]
MVRPSNVIVAILNVLILGLAILAIGFSFWFQFHSGSSLCQKVLYKPLLYLGLALLVISVFGLLGSCCGIKFFLWIYLAVMFFLILGLVCFMFFTLVVTNKRVGQAISNKGVNEHRLGDYSKWLQRYVVNADNWDEIKSCLADVHLCQQIDSGKSPDFYKKGLPLLQSGCCKPPTYCGFQFQNATVWIMPKKGPAVPDTDCKTWSNDQTKLCFDCDSCKISFLENIKNEWKTLAIINSCTLAVVIFIYTVGCCALRSNRSRGYTKHRSYP